MIICDECETVAHCTKHGCIPKQPLGCVNHDCAKCKATPAPVQEPVAWMHWLNGPCRVWMNKDEAMMELDRLNREYPVDSHARKMRPLVFGDTTPPAAPPALVQQPATLDEMHAIGNGIMYGEQPAPVPDKITDNSESPDYRDGWNDCRELMLGGQL